MQIDLKNKSAIVTGASRGIGKAIALTLAQAGAQVALVARNAGQLEEVAAAIGAAGGKAIVLPCDITDTAAIQKTVEEAEKAFGKIDILVNNAGMTKDGLLLRMKDEDWDAVLNTNLKSTFAFCRAASRNMMRNRSGSIINLTSVIGLYGNAGQINYAASKAGIIGVTKSIAKEFGSRNVRCNAVAPGLIDTDMTAVLDEKVRTEIKKRISLERFGSPQEVANVVAFLASDLAAYITAQVIVVDGCMSS